MFIRIPALLLCAVTLLLTLLVACGAQGTGATNYKEGVGVPQEIMPTDFHRDGVEIEYNTTPPTSGDHASAAIRCGFYGEEVPDEFVVHNMEHGNVIMSYNLADSAAVGRLKEIHDSLEGGDRWLVTRFYTEIPEGDIAMTAWGVLDQFTGIDEVRISKFLEAYKGNRFSGETRSLGRGITCNGA